MADCVYTPRVREMSAAVCLRQSAGTGPGGRIVGEGYGDFNLGLHVNDDPARVEERRRALEAHCQLTSICWLNQVHGTAVIEQRGQEATASAPTPDADAHWTREPALGLAIVTADCLPILLWDHESRWVAAAHGGWRGLTAGILDAVLQSLADAGCPLRAGSWSSWLGPAISQERYQVDAPVQAAVRARPAAEAAELDRKIIRPCPEQADRWRLGLAALARADLKRAGSAVVHGAEECVYSARRFYSHRRASRAGSSATGRQVSLIWIRP